MRNGPGVGGWGGDLFVFFIPNESSHTQPKKKLRIISALITVISVCICVCVCVLAVVSYILVLLSL